MSVVLPLFPAITATMRLGRMAIERVIRFLCHRGNLISTNPCDVRSHVKYLTSITNCPAYVPVRVELCPDARRAMPNTTLAALLKD
jgi:hypothetical protein